MGETRKAQKAAVARLATRNIDVGALPVGEGKVFKAIQWDSSPLARFCVRGRVTDPKERENQRTDAHVCLLCLEANGYVSQKGGVFMSKVTSTVWNHMRRIHKAELEAAETKPRDNGRADKSGEKEAAIRRWKLFAQMGNPERDEADLAWSYKDLDALAALVTSTTSLPDAVWNDEAFRSLLRAINPRWIPPRRRAIRHRADAVIGEAKADVKCALKDQYVSVVVDEWVGRHCTRRFLGVAVVGFIRDEWMTVFLGVVKIVGSSTAEHLKQMVDGVLEQWGIFHDHVVAYVSDSGSNIKKALSDRVMIDSMPSSLQADLGQVGGLEALDTEALDFFIQTQLGGTQDPFAGSFASTTPIGGGRDLWEQAIEAGRAMGGGAPEQRPLRFSTRQVFCFSHQIHTVSERCAEACPVMAKVYQVAKAIVKTVGSSKAATEALQRQCKLVLVRSSNIRWLSNHHVLHRLLQVLHGLDDVLLDEEAESGVNGAFFESLAEMEAWKAAARRTLRLMAPLVVANQILSLDKGPSGSYVFLTLLDLKQRYAQYGEVTTHEEYLPFVHKFHEEAERKFGDVLPDDRGQINKGTFAGLAFFDPYNSSLAKELGVLELVVAEGKRLLLQSPLSPEAPQYPMRRIAQLDRRLVELREQAEGQPARHRRCQDLLDADEIPEEPLLPFAEEIRKVEEQRQGLIDGHSAKLRKYAEFEAAMNLYAAQFSSLMYKPQQKDEELTEAAQAKRALDHLANRIVDFWHSDAALPYTSILAAVKYWLSIPSSSAQVERSFARLSTLTGDSYARRSNRTVMNRFFAATNRGPLIHFARLRYEGHSAEADLDVSESDVIIEEGGADESRQDHPRQGQLLPHAHTQ